MKLGVKFDNSGCLVVPDVSTGMPKGAHAVNAEKLRDYGTLLREAQTHLDRISTLELPELFPGTTEQEKELFETLRQLNAEAVLRILVMRRLAVAGLTGR